jgi:hypothetical protein
MSDTTELQSEASATEGLSSTEGASLNDLLCASCVGCKFLYTIGEGYSNFTWMDNIVNCAKDRNKNLPDSEPYDWKWSAESDKWPKTNSSRCELYAAGDKVSLDVDGDDYPDDYTSDIEAITVIQEHSGRSR